ncbi:AI-2E family transporter [Candidatus Pacearchaeota archaeon]|nr:AI-2E family transporter [Candidatus Pacearchaeota archaeon]
MESGSKKELKKYLFWGISIILIILSYQIIKNFIIPLISAFILAYLVKPVYDKLDKKLGSTFSATICIILIILVIIVPLGLLATDATLQAASFTKDINVQEGFDYLTNLPILENINIDLASLTNGVVSLAAGLITATLSKLPSLMLGIFITLMGTFYILTKWDTLAKELKKYIPFSKKDKIIKELKTTTNNIIYGLILVASIEFIVAIVGLYLLGIEFYILLSALIFFTAFFPGLGPTIIWVPIAIYFFIMGDISHGIGTIVLGLILSSGVDIILRGKIMGEKANINPLIMLLGILGGISVFGIFGILIGPLVLIYAIKLTNDILKS